MKIEGLVKVWIKSVLFVYLWTESHITFIAKWRTKSYLHIIAIVSKMFNYFISEQDILFFPLVSMWRNTNALSNCINCPERRVYLLQKFRRFRRGKTNQSCLNSQHRITMQVKELCQFWTRYLFWKMGKFPFCEFAESHQINNSWRKFTSTYLDHAM